MYYVISGPESMIYEAATIERAVRLLELDEAGAICADIDSARIYAAVHRPGRPSKGGITAILGVAANLAEGAVEKRELRKIISTKPGRGRPKKPIAAVK